MFERFTEQARAVVVRAQTESADLEDRHIGTEHLLLSLLQSDGPGPATLTRLGLTPQGIRRALRTEPGEDGPDTGPLDTGPLDTGPLDAEDARALRALGIDLDEVRRHAEAAFGEGALDEPPAGGEDDGGGPRRRRRRSRTGHIPFTSQAKKTLERSLRESLDRKDGFIGSEHLTLALLSTALHDPGDTAARLLAQAGVDPVRARETVTAALGEPGSGRRTWRRGA